MSKFMTGWKPIPQQFAICNETFADWPCERAFPFVRECGYAGIEIAPFTLGRSADDISTAERMRVRELAAGEGLEVVGLHWLLARTEGYYLTANEPFVRRQTSIYLGELARLCRDLGGSVLVLGSPNQRRLQENVSFREGMDYAADVIRGALPYFVDHNVVLAIEPLSPAEDNFLLTANDAAELARRIDSPHVRLHLDVKAMSSEATPIPQIIREHADQLVHFHANDPNLRGPGMGDVDFVPIFQALQDIRYSGWISVEVFDYSPGAEALARESISYMRRCWDTLSNPGA